MDNIILPRTVVININNFLKEATSLVRDIISNNEKHVRKSKSEVIITIYSPSDSEFSKILKTRLNEYSKKYNFFFDDDDKYVYFNHKTDTYKVPLYIKVDSGMVFQGHESIGNIGFIIKFDRDNAKKVE